MDRFRVIEHFPTHECYVEPFGGGASVLLAKEQARFEVLNDLDGRVANFWRVMRDPRSNRELRRILMLTPYCREEYEAARDIAEDPVEDARRFYVTCYQGYGRGHAGGGFALQIAGYGWGKNRPRQFHQVSHFQAIRRRLARVQLENRPALDVIARTDRPTTLFYLDPPYVRGARASGNALYHHEMTDDDQTELLAAITGLQGMVVLSGYDHPLYNEALSGWRRVTWETRGESQKRVTECLWISPAADAARANGQGELFGGV